MTLIPGSDSAQLREMQETDTIRAVEYERWLAIPAYLRGSYPYRTPSELAVARRVDTMLLEAQAAMWRAP